LLLRFAATVGDVLACDLLFPEFFVLAEPVIDVMVCVQLLKDQ